MTDDDQTSDALRPPQPLPLDMPLVKPPPPDSRYEKWCRWLEEINEETTTLWWHRTVWRALLDMVQRNPDIPPSHVFDYLANTFTTSQAIGVRRQAEARQGVVSLGALLCELRDNSKVLTRNRYVGLFPAGMAQAIGAREFESGNTNGWNATNTPAVTTDQAHTGLFSMTFTGSFDVTDSPNGLTTQRADVVRADFWAKGPASDTVRVKFRQYLSGGNNELYQSFTLTGGWDHFVSKALHLYNPGVTGVDFNIDNPGANSTHVFYLDDIKELGYVAAETCGYDNLVNGLNADAVENCGGEAPYGTQFWAGDSNTTLSTDTADAHDGNYSFKMVAGSSGTITMNDSPDHRDVGEVATSATSCTATAWMKGPSGGSRSMKLRIREYNSGQGGLMGTSTATATPNGSWQQLSVTRTLASGHNSSTHLDLNPYMTGASANDVVRVDDVTSVCS